LRAQRRWPCNAKSIPICYPGGGTAGGIRGDHVLLAPPFIIDDEQVGELVSRLGDAIDAAFDDIC